MSDTEARRRLSDWFHRWHTPLRRFLIGKTALPVADLDDVSQEVFLRLLRYGQTELVEQPQAYLFKIASNVAAEWSMRARSRHPHDSNWLANLIVEDLPEEDAARESLQREIERAINTLSPRYREVLKLQFAEGLGHSEIAARLGTSPRSVKRYIRKSYEKLRVELESELPGAVNHGRR